MHIRIILIAAVLVSCSFAKFARRENLVARRSTSANFLPLPDEFGVAAASSRGVRMTARLSRVVRTFRMEKRRLGTMRFLC